ncbi:hypothetical protein WH52_13290 [Tenacibaculum holothuriorum]|uniref:Uncharacterized protein n=2 Tax=Tenacibaculum holothuriorum TaxID=1635173 RepID=A0A1Y2P9B2_9FLAO|nr:hypothetical protein WH52_13290 [Tenacibaculum holothuriorum]
MLQIDITPEWSRIKELLLQLHSKGIIFCPLSNEHYIETSWKEYKEAKNHDLFLNKISDEFCFKTEAFLTSQLISSRIRKNKITVKTYLHTEVKEILKDSDNYKFYREKNTELFKTIKEIGHDTNEFKKLTSNQKIDSKTQKIMFNALMHLEAQKFIQRLEKLYDKGKLMIESYKSTTSEFPKWTDLVLDILIKKHKFRKKEIQKLIFELKSNGFKNISTLNIRFSLISLMNLRSKKDSSNDQIDIARISTSLDFSDIMLTDKKRKHEIHELELDKLYNTKVFSGIKSDLDNLILVLEKL